jgi:murein DD-endopeptidase MepM/ murein hydrolase activator NlpD
LSVHLRIAAVLLCALGLKANVAWAADVEVRFFPAQRLWAQQTDAPRGLHNLLLPNAAVVNRGELALSLKAVRFELLLDDFVLQTQHLGPEQLQVLAKRGAQLAQAGMMQVLDFQFAPDILFGEGVTVGAQRRLEPGEALYLPPRLFVYAGKPQRLRVVASFEGEADEVSAEITLRHDVAPGRYRFPVKGRWYVAAAGTPHSHHRWAVNQSFALDLGRIGQNGLSYKGRGTRMRDFHAYGAPVLAVADGEVIEMRDDMPDSIDLLRQAGESIESQMQRVLARQDAWMAEGGRDIVGNYVMIGHADGVYSVYAHLAPGSVAVKSGDNVRGGQRIGAVGSSGSSTEPHLHFHACDRPALLHCEGLPIAFEELEIVFADHPRQIQSGDLVDAP